MKTKLNSEHVDDGTTLRAGAEIGILTHGKNLGELEKRWQPKQQADAPSGLDASKKIESN